MRRRVCPEESVHWKLLISPRRGVIFSCLPKESVSNAPPGFSRGPGWLVELRPSRCLCDVLLLAAEWRFPIRTTLFVVRCSTHEMHLTEIRYDRREFPLSEVHRDMIFVLGCCIATVHGRSLNDLYLYY